MNIIYFIDIRLICFSLSFGAKFRKLCLSRILFIPFMHSYKVFYFIFILLFLIYIFLIFIFSFIFFGLIFCSFLIFLIMDA